MAGDKSVDSDCYVRQSSPSRSTSDRKREHGGSFIQAYNKKELSSSSPDKMMMLIDPHANAPDPHKFTLEAEEEDMNIVGPDIRMGDIFADEDGMGEGDLVDDGFFDRLMGPSNDQ